MPVATVLSMIDQSVTHIVSTLLFLYYDQLERLLQPFLPLRERRAFVGGALSFGRAAGCVEHL
jgi:hypothetical protein